MSTDADLYAAIKDEPKHATFSRLRKMGGETLVEKFRVMLKRLEDGPPRRDREEAWRLARKIPQFFPGAPGMPSWETIYEDQSNTKGALPAGKNADVGDRGKDVGGDSAAPPVSAAAVGHGKEKAGQDVPDEATAAEPKASKDKAFWGVYKAPLIDESDKAVSFIDEIRWVHANFVRVVRKSNENGRLTFHWKRAKSPPPSDGATRLMIHAAETQRGLSEFNAMALKLLTQEEEIRDEDVKKEKKSISEIRGVLRRLLDDVVGK